MNAPHSPALDEAQAEQSLVPAIPDEPVLPLSVEGYHALLKAGILQDGDPIELLEGFMVLKMRRGPRHAFACRRLRGLLEKVVLPGFFVDKQCALTTSTSEPEPDPVVIRGDIDDYADRHPGPDEIVLVVEVADLSVQRDRTWKERIYGRAGIASYWMVNLVDECIEVHSQPTGSGDLPSYCRTGVYRAGQSIAVVIDGREIGHIAVVDVLGEPTKSKAGRGTADV